MGLVESFVRNPVKIAVGVLLLLLFGGIALARMPDAADPRGLHADDHRRGPTGRGASPQEVEREIVQEQEEQLKGVEGVQSRCPSECMDSSGKITLEFGVGDGHEPPRCSR